MHTKPTLKLLFSLCIVGWLYRDIQNLPTYVDLDSRVGCHLNRAPRSFLCKIILKENVFVVPSGLNSLLKVYVLNKIIVSPVLS